MANGFSPLWRLIGPSLAAAPGARTFQSAATNEFTNATELLRSNRSSSVAAPGDRRGPLKAAEPGKAGARPSSVAATFELRTATVLVETGRISNVRIASGLLGAAGTSGIAAPEDRCGPLKAANAGEAGARPSPGAAMNGFTDATQLLRSNRKSDIAAPGDGRAPAEKASLWHPPMCSVPAPAGRHVYSCPTTEILAPSGATWKRDMSPRGGFVYFGPLL